MTLDLRPENVLLIGDGDDLDQGFGADIIIRAENGGRWRGCGGAVRLTCDGRLLCATTKRVGSRGSGLVGSKGRGGLGRGRGIGRGVSLEKTRSLMGASWLGRWSGG